MRRPLGRNQGKRDLAGAFARERLAVGAEKVSGARAGGTRGRHRRSAARRRAGGEGAAAENDEFAALDEAGCVGYDARGIGRLDRARRSGKGWLARTL